MFQTSKNAAFVFFFTFLLQAQVKCCARENFNYLKITVTEELSNKEEKRGVFLISGASDTDKQSLILSTSGATKCPEAIIIKEYEERLREAAWIEVKNYVIPTLRHGDIQNLENLTQIKLGENDIEEVQPGAFLNLPTLSQVNLEFNRITAIPRGVFGNLSVSKLYLNDNNISHIATDAFDNMPNLKIVNLYNNRLAKWNPHWFTNTPNIENLLFSFNKLTELPEGAFYNFRAIKTIKMSHNKISFIEPTAFHGLNGLSILDLQGNRIANLPEELFLGLKSLLELQLDHNNITCISDKVLESFGGELILNIKGNPMTRCACLQRMLKWNLETRVNISETVHFIKYMHTMCYGELTEELEDVKSGLQSALERISELEEKRY